MREIQIVILEKIQKISGEGIKTNRKKREIIEMIYELQKYCRMLRELEIMKYVLAPEDEGFDEGFDEGYYEMLQEEETWRWINT